MALSDRKIEAADIVGHKVADRPDTASNQAETVKGWFDDLNVNFIIPAISGVVDDLVAVADGASGADQIGATAIISGGATTVQGILDQMFSMIYPVGSIYMSVNNANPSTLFGGTWAAWGAGRVPVGVDGTQTEFDTVEEEGGAKTVTLTSAQSGVPAHTHPPGGGTAIVNYVGTGGNLGGAGTIMSGTGTTGFNTAANAAQAHTNLQPYITCYMWKRTA